MTESELVRRLTTIMDIDVVGFSTMSARDEEHALSLLNARMATAQGLVKHHRGRVFKLTGDGLLAEFVSPVEAVRAALEIQEAMRAANDPAGPNDQLVLRIGVNLGDVVESGDDLMGDAVNVAARLESIAKPGGICVSAAVYEQIEGKLTLGAEDLGEQHVKNIPRAIHAYRLTLGGAAPTAVTVAAPTAPGKKASRVGVIVGGGALVAVLAIAGAWLLHERSEPAPPPAPVAQASAPPVAATPAPQQAAVPSAPVPPPTASKVAPPQPPSTPPPSRAYSAADVPFVPHWREQRLLNYGEAGDAKALAINVRGWFAVAERRIDDLAARRAALESCNALVEREVKVARDFDRCMLYAVGNNVVWTFRPPPMPPAPYLPAARPSPPIAFDPALIPLINDQARRNLNEHYMKNTKHRALVLGHGHLDWWSPSEDDKDAIRRNLQTCGHLTGRPCVVYSVDDQVVVRVPQLRRVVNIFTPQELSGLDAGQQAAVEKYLVENDWRALAAGGNGRLGIVSGRAGEAAAIADALAACTKDGGTVCRLVAIGPFVVEPN